MRRRTAPAKRLLAWYGVNRRELPWRAKPGQASDPYRVWLSEIMLQQTTVAAVGPYYAKFLRQWPCIESLAAAALDDVLAAWAGLGYYSRARNLHRTARIVALERGGAFPRGVDELLRLPGVGLYTAGAVAAIAFGARAVAIDANAERVLARFFAVEEPLPKAKPRLRTLGASLLPTTGAGDFAQALMDLGALVCTPKTPDCGKCPWRRDCRARALGIAGQGKKAGAAFATRRGIRGAGRAGRRPAREAGGKRPPWRDDATADDAMERNVSLVRGGVTLRALPRQMEKTRRQRPPRFHAFRTGD